MTGPHLASDYLEAQLAYDFSQSGEQAAILEAVEGLPIGRFLDIGAGDGLTFSNTRCLALRGWEGVCVEPAAWAFDKLADLYLNEPKMVLVQAVVTPEHGGIVPWHYAKDDHLSTVVDSEARKWPQVPFRRGWAAALGLLEVLDGMCLLGEHPISVVSIDAEGITGDLVKAYIRTPYWEDVQLIVYEREHWHAKGSLTLTGTFELVAETPNNLIYRRGS